MLNRRNERNQSSDHLLDENICETFRNICKVISIFRCNWFKNECPIRADKCDPVPYDAAMKWCKAKQNDYWFQRFFYENVGECKLAAEKAFKEYCIEAKNEIPSCYQFYPTTANKMIPFIIGGVIGVIATLAIGIGIFCYCKKKKASGPGQSMTGTTTGRATATGNTTKTGTKTNTGTTKAATTTGAPTARY
ncbi:hypothetical protein L5515_002292 [Caenorhabditis briggsae]|uniref:Uncharacterized protein n=1 Tax=Caenorhabditis briggsae TaxID=6238 RepID=A0AAE9DVR0_CAEBR|nr:hypothetical protein L3Y34_016223 [Caenorhabditis briggsae]UMM14519.1 hypothetical protein L5515_002292 [Caenorhabditis briggsae]